MTDDKWGDSRSRVIEWKDPVPPGKAAFGMDGMTYLTALLDGEIPPPPITAVMNMTLQSIEKGRAVFTLTPDESLYNPIGAVHGGAICTILDSAAGCAVHSTLEPGWAYTSIDLNVTYLRPVTLSTGRVVATGTVVKGGKRVSYASGEVRDAAGALIATATGSLLMMPPAVSATPEVSPTK